MTTEPMKRVLNETLSSLNLRNQPPVQALKVAFMSAIGILLLLSLSTHVILKKQIEDNESSARMVNTSSYLRTGSQRAALLARNLVTTSNLTERVNVRKEILLEVRRMKAAKNALLNGDVEMGIPARHSPEVNRLFHEAPVFLNRKIEKFLQEATALAYSLETELGPGNAHMKYLRKEASGDKFLADLDALVRQYQNESEARLARLQEYERLIVFSQILILILMAVFIFKPLVDRVGREIDALNSANDTLEQRVAERTAIAEQRATKLRESERLALLDPLTEVLNRRGLATVLAREAKSATEGGFCWVALLVDLDNFKTINDNFGHAVGDHVLKEVGRILKSSLRSGDIVTRIGGDEFLVLLPQTSSAFAVSFAEKIRLGIASTQIYASAFDRVPVSASLGLVAVSNPNVSVEDLLRSTHNALYRSKNAGKNRVSYEAAAS